MGVGRGLGLGISSLALRIFNLKGVASGGSASESQYMGSEVLAGFNV